MALLFVGAIPVLVAGLRHDRPGHIGRGNAHCCGEQGPASQAPTVRDDLRRLPVYEARLRLAWQVIGENDTQHSAAESGGIRPVSAVLSSNSGFPMTGAWGALARPRDMRG